METQQKTHPSNRVLAAFALDRLAVDARSRIEAHVQACPSCSDFVRQTPKIELQALLRSGTVMSQAEQSTPGERTRDTVGTPAAKIGQQKSPAAQAPGASISRESIPPALRQQTKYRIMRLLGRGGMGSVYQAHHERMDRLVAIKVINPDLVDNQQAIDRFNAEVIAVAKLDHRNIARAYDAETFGSLQTIVMEFVPGQTVYDFMKARLKAGNPLSVSEACRLVRQALVGLQHAHERGIAHRDLKPQNLMLTRDEGIVKILDFGLAKLTSDRSHGLTKTNVTMGTYEYLSPEQALDAASADIRSDIYSLGCTLYYLLAGKLPFDYPTDAKLLMAHQTEIAKPLAEARPDVPRAVSDLVGRMLAKKPEDRPQTPAEAAQVLLPYARGENPLPGAALSSGALPDDVMAMIGSQPTLSGSRRLTSAGSRRANSQLTDFIRRRWIPVSIVAMAAAAALIVAFAGLFKIRSSEGTIVLSVSQPNAEVLVDGQTITVQWGEDGKTAQISAPPGRHRVEVRKQGFTASGKEVTLQDGGHEILSVTLETAAKEEPPRAAQSGPVVGTAFASSDAAAPSQPAPATQFPLGQWVDVLRLVDTNSEMVVAGKWSRNGEEITVESSGHARVVIPVAVKGSYDFEVAFTRTSGWNDVDALLSIDSHPCTAIVSGWGGRFSGLGYVGGQWPTEPGNPTSRSPGELQNGRRYQLLISARVDSDNHASVDVSLDGKSYMPRWSGDPATLSAAECFTVPTPDTLGLGAQLSAVVFHSARLKMISGSATLDPTVAASDHTRSERLKDPAFQQWMNDVAAMPAEQQVQAVVKKLQELNPEFDGKETHKIENGVVTELRFVTDSVTDISPVRALGGLTSLFCHGSARGKGALSDLSPLKGLHLTTMGCERSHVSDLSPLTGMPLERLFIRATPISDLSPLKGVPLAVLHCGSTRISDLSPLRGMPLTELWCERTHVSDLSPLKGAPLRHLLAWGTPMSDISPLRGLPLEFLSCGDLVSDLSPLRGTSVTRLWCGGKVTDLSPLAGLRLVELRCNSAISDLSPLKGMRLESLWCNGSHVVDLSPLKGMPLATVVCDATPICDLSPLSGMSLKELYFTPKNVTSGINVVRKMASLATIGVDFWHKLPAAEFWKKYDAGEFGKPDVRSNDGDGQPTATPRSTTTATGKFVRLFNGSDLDGWTFDGPNRDGWRVEDGEIINEGAGNANHNFLLTNRDYSDYVLRLEFRVEPTTSTSVAMRAIPGELLMNAKSAPRSEHPKVKLVGTVDKRPTGTTFWVTTKLNVEPNLSATTRPVGEWNSMEMTVRGNTLEVKLNGSLLDVISIPAYARFSDGQLPGLCRTSGRIGLERNTGRIEFRNIEVMELAPGSGTAGKASVQDGGSATPADTANDGGSANQTGTASDAIQPNSVWRDATRVLTILERNGNTFRARFEVGSSIVREVYGNVEGDQIYWRTNGVNAIQGGRGGNNFGTIHGDKIDFSWFDANASGDSGKFTLSRSK